MHITVMSVSIIENMVMKFIIEKELTSLSRIRELSLSEGQMTV
jgi:hypothetical protein